MTRHRPHRDTQERQPILVDGTLAARLERYEKIHAPVMFA